MFEYLTIILGLIMGLLSLVKENKKKTTKPVKYRILKWNINKFWYDTTIISLMVLIAMAGLCGKYFNDKSKSDQNIEKIAQCNKALSFACDQVRGSFITYFLNRKNSEKEISDKIFTKDLINNGEMFERFLDLYKDQVDTNKTKILIQTIGFLKQYSEFIIKDTNTISTLNSLICAIDTAQKRYIPLFIDRDFLGK